MRYFIEMHLVTKTWLNTAKFQLFSLRQLVFIPNFIDSYLVTSTKNNHRDITSQSFLQFKEQTVPTKLDWGNISVWTFQPSYKMYTEVSTYNNSDDGTLKQYNNVILNMNTVMTCSFMLLQKKIPAMVFTNLK